METGRRDARTGVVCAAPTAARLANVVRRARTAGTESVARGSGGSPFSKQGRGSSFVKRQPVSQLATTLHSRGILSIPFYHAWGTSKNRRVVEAPVARRIFSRSSNRTRRARSTINDARLYFGMPK